MESIIAKQKIRIPVQLYSDMTSNKNLKITIS